jgi:hypothetical protein
MILLAGADLVWAGCSDGTGASGAVRVCAKAAGIAADAIAAKATEVVVFDALEAASLLVRQEVSEVPIRSKLSADAWALDRVQRLRASRFGDLRGRDEGSTEQIRAKRCG